MNGEKEKEKKDGKKKKMWSRGKRRGLASSTANRGGGGEEDFWAVYMEGENLQYTKKRGRNQWTPQNVYLDSTGSWVCFYNA
jgi:hypothetical protein